MPSLFNFAIIQIVKIEQFPKLVGRQMVQVFAPNISEKVNTKSDKRVLSDKEQ